MLPCVGLQHALHNKQWWIWAGAGYIAAIVLLLNLLVILALKFLSSKLCRCRHCRLS